MNTRINFTNKNLISSKLSFLVCLNFCFFLAQAQSPKRGIAYGEHSLADMNIIKPGITWWYNWSQLPDTALDKHYTNLGVEFVPMAWGGITNVNSIISKIKPGAKYLLAFNEPNFNDGARLTPQQAVDMWPKIEEIANAKNLEIVSASPAFNGPYNYGGYTSPVAWHDEFFKLCPSCKVDHIAFHDYSDNAGAIIYLTGLLKKYNRPIWVTEFANRVIQTSDQKINFMKEILNSFENDPDIFRYSWFTGRVPSHWTDMLEGQLYASASGSLSKIGNEYVNYDYKQKISNIPGRVVANKHYRRRGTTLENTTDGGTGQNVTQINTNDWAEYILNVANSNEYEMTFRLASATDNAIFDIYVNDTLVKENETLKATGNSQTFENKVVSGINLSKGVNYIKIVFKSDRFNLNYIDILNDASLGANEISLERKTSIYPNPFNDFTTIHFDNKVGDSSTIIIKDVFGKVVYKSNELSSLQNDFQIGTELIKGNYIVTISSGTIEQSYKITKN